MSDMFLAGQGLDGAGLHEIAAATLAADESLTLDRWGHLHRRGCMPRCKAHGGAACWVGHDRNAEA